MSWGTCYSGSNNIFTSAPPLMSDGRNYANWKTGCEIDQSIKKNAGILSNSDYRLFLINNADKIIEFNQLESCNNCGCCPYFQSNSGKMNRPFLYETDCYAKNNDCRPFGYENSDLKNLYLSREQLAAFKTQPLTFIKSK